MRSLSIRNKLCPSDVSINHIGHLEETSSSQVGLSQGARLKDYNKLSNSSYKLGLMRKMDLDH